MSFISIITLLPQFEAYTAKSKTMTNPKYPYCQLCGEAYDACGVSKYCPDCKQVKRKQWTSISNRKAVDKLGTK